MRNLERIWEGGYINEDGMTRLICAKAGFYMERAKERQLLVRRNKSYMSKYSCLTHLDNHLCGLWRLRAPRRVQTVVEGQS